MRVNHVRAAHQERKPTYGRAHAPRRTHTAPSALPGWPGKGQKEAGKPLPLLWRQAKTWRVIHRGRLAPGEFLTQPLRMMRSVTHSPGRVQERVSGSQLSLAAL